AIILVSAERAKDFSREVVFRATSHVSDILPMSGRDFLEFEGPQHAMAQAFSRAGIKVGDLDFAEVHDCFTIAELLVYEAMGLAPKGAGHRVLDDGTVFRDGALPVNVSGGLKAKGHPVGATGVSMHAISFRQLTGGAGDMQLNNPQLGLVFNMGGTGVANYASVLEARKA
ncbi:MAG TPA: thiolase domain-containing protein, partial [Candidimonas sp.]|nr:thiolase domain-containing protein [Candidimonas sp.]